ncbi:MAG: hypothetical protein ACE5GX_03315, partial [Thermoanaerobaculia bacterium]
MPRTLVPVIVLGCLAMAGIGEDTRVAAWQEDLAYLVRELEIRHPNLYHTISRDDLKAAVGEIHDAIPRLDDPEIVVAFSRLTASIGDGHTGIFIPWNDQLGYSRLPVEIWEEEQGLMIA